MSIAPAKSASIAAGPALKLVHSTFTCDPMALSKKPLFFPTMACACVMLGKAPTRIAVCPQAEIEIASTTSPKNLLLVTLLASNHHGEDAGGFFFLIF